MIIGKNIALTGWTFVGKVMSLLFNMLSRLEKEMATHSSTLAWKIPWATIHWVTKSRTQLHFHFQVGHSFSSKEQ